jgi:hypothetical protein
MKEGTLQFALGKYLPSCKVGTRLLEGKWKVPSGLQEVGRYLPACLTVMEGTWELAQGAYLSAACLADLVEGRTEP